MPKAPHTSLNLKAGADTMGMQRSGACHSSVLQGAVLSLPPMLSLAKESSDKSQLLHPVGM